MGDHLLKNTFNLVEFHGLLASRSVSVHHHIQKDPKDQHMVGDHLMAKDHHMARDRHTVKDHHMARDHHTLEDHHVEGTHLMVENHLMAGIHHMAEKDKPKKIISKYSNLV